MKSTDIYKLYAVTDRSWVGEMTFSEQIIASLKGGVTMLQLREKELNSEDFLKSAIEVKAICQQYNVPFIINDDVNTAKTCDADGIHVGQSDMNTLDVRKIIGPDKLLGVSVQTVDQALIAQEQGADYLGVGAVFSTSTKTDAKTVSTDIVKAICQAVDIPVVAIGGINKDNISQLSGLGLKGVAVVSALYGANNIEESTKHMRSQVSNLLKEAL